MASVKKKPGIVYRDSEEKYIKRIEVYCNGFDESSQSSQMVKLYYDKEFTIPVKAKDFSDILVNGLLRIVINGAEMEFGVRFNTLMQQAGESVLLGVINGPGFDVPIVAMEGDDPVDPSDRYKLVINPPIVGADSGFDFTFNESDLVLEGDWYSWTSDENTLASDCEAIYNCLNTLSYVPTFYYNQDMNNNPQKYVNFNKKTSQVESDEEAIYITYDGDEYLASSNSGFTIYIPRWVVEQYGGEAKATICFRGIYHME